MRAILPLAFALCAGLAQAAENSVSYVTFPTLAEPALSEAGKLTIPPPGQSGGKVPAVLILHGSAGIDSRGASYAEMLAQSGIATLEIDMWAARGTARGVKGRPKSVPGTIPDAFGAIRFLAAQPEIDPTRIGVLGYSWGAVVTMLASTHFYADRYQAEGLTIKAASVLYPVCWIYNHLDGYGFKDLVASPLLIQTGAIDDYDETPETCQTLLAGLPATDRDHVRLITYEGAGHGFDRSGEALHGSDPMSHRGKGGDVNLVFEPKASAAAHREVQQFFVEKLTDK